MKIFDRYILRAFAGALGVAMLVMVGLYFLLHFFTHLRYLGKAKEAFAAQGTSLFSGFCTYYMVHIPEMMALFGPYAVLMAAMYTLHQLNQDNELSAMYAVGVTRLRVAAPLFAASGVVALGLMTIKESVVPTLLPDMTRYHLLIQGDATTVSDDVPPVRDGKGNVFVFGSWNRDAWRLAPVRVFRPGRRKRVDFDSIQWIGDIDRGHWAGTPASAVDGFDLTRDTDLDPADIDTGPRTRSRLSFAALRRVGRKRPERLDIQTTMYAHMTYPFSPIVLLLLGLPLVMRARTKSVFIGLGIAIILSLMYFSATQVLIRVGAQGGLINPLLAAWLPIIVFGSVGLLLFEAPDR